MPMLTHGELASSTLLYTALFYCGQWAAHWFSSLTFKTYATLVPSEQVRTEQKPVPECSLALHSRAGLNQQSPRGWCRPTGHQA